MGYRRDSRGRFSGSTGGFRGIFGGMSHRALGEVQFVGLRELAGMKSGDYPGLVGDAASHYAADKRNDPGEKDRFKKVSRSVQREGVKEPLVVDRWKDTGVDQLRDGHRRAMSALQHGVQRVPVRFVRR